MALSASDSQAICESLNTEEIGNLMTNPVFTVVVTTTQENLWTDTDIVGVFTSYAGAIGALRDHFDQLGDEFPGIDPVTIDEVGQRHGTVAWAQWVRFDWSVREQRVTEHRPVVALH
jgi:hypothetical protein